MIDTCCLYNLIKIFSSLHISALVSGWNWWMNLPKLSRELSEYSLAIIRGCLLVQSETFREVFRFYITLQNNVNAGLDKTEMLMNQNAIKGN